MITDYKVLQANTTVALNALITAAIADDWEPTGGLSVNERDQAYFQAVKKGSDEDSIADMQDDINALEALSTITAVVAGAALPTKGIVFLSGASLQHYTLAAPAADGDQVEIHTTTNFAHDITTPANLIFDGTATTKDTATFAAFKGASLKLRGYGGKWYVNSSNAVTLTEV